jgi:MFS family permease
VAERPTLSRGISFWFLTILFVLLLCAASAPSPLYPVYQAMWGFPAITLTAIYASYAFGAIAALLVTGRLSDHLGRRPVLLLALVLEVAGMLMFLAADGVTLLFVGRLVVGVATGIAIGALSAWLIDLQPPGNPRLGGLTSGVAVILGLGLGACVSGVLVQYAPYPLQLVYLLLAGAYVLGAAGIAVVADPVERRPGWVASLRPVVGVPPDARSMFVAAAPALVGMWALGGLYLALGPSLAISILGSDSRVAGGLLIFALTGTGAVASVLVRRSDAEPLLVRGCEVLIGGVAVTLVGVWLRSAFVLYAGSVLAGIGLGPAFSAYVRIIAPLAPPEGRGGLLGAMYLSTYLSFSVPTLIAGAAVTLYGLRDTTLAYGVAVMLLATATTVVVARRLRGLNDRESAR